MNSLNMFIHFSEEMVSRLYQSIYWTDTIFKLKTRIKSIQKILAVFSIHVWLKLLHEQTFSQYDCIPSLRAVKMLAISITNYFVEKGEAFVVFFSEYGFLWSFVIQYKLEKSSCSLLSRVFNDEINDLWSTKYSSLS
jgi:hypothetical protein